MSGGVDSSVAAYLMQQRGFRCEGTTMRLYRNADIGLSQFRTCCSQRDIDDAAEVAFQLDIPYEVLDFTMDFKSRVIEKFIRIYESGGTPNPCIDCNRYMKFDSLLRFAEEKGPESALYTGTLFARDLNWISVPGLDGPMRVRAKTRYRQAEQPATVYPEGPDCIRLEFDQPQRAVTVGQALVLYDGDLVVGGGTISRVPEA